MFAQPSHSWDNHWLMVDGSSDLMDTPELISNYRPLKTNGSRLQHGQVTNHSITSKIYDGNLVKVSLSKAIVDKASD